MVPEHSTSTACAITALALAVRSALQDTGTPKAIRDKLICFAAELRDRLSLDKAFSVDAAEAEAVILAFVETSPQPSLDGNTHQNHQPCHQTLSAPESISVSSE
jgi:hypothetical protein